MKLTRRDFAKLTAMAGGALMLPWNVRRAFAAGSHIPGGSLHPHDVDKFVTPLVKPPAMPGSFRRSKDKFKIGVRQFQQQILPTGMPETTVWSYGPDNKAPR